MSKYMFDWDGCGRERFDAVVEALLVEKHTRERTGHAQVVDGRGGDGGIDVGVTLPDGTLDTIYQLKYFPEGLSGNFRDTRRKQVQHSYAAAMQHAPRRWVLVAPCNMTPKEKSWLRRLAGDDGVVPNFMGMTELERELALSPHIFRHFTTEPRLEALKIAGAERSLLSTPRDIAKAAVSLQERLSAQSLYWKITAQAEDDGSVVQRIQPRRPDASAKEPLGVSFGVRSDDQEAHAAISSFIAGAPELVLRPEQLLSVNLEGPPWFADSQVGAGLRITRQNSRKTLEAELRLCDEDGSALASLSGTVTGNRNIDGSTGLALKMRGGLEFDFLIPREAQNREGPRPSGNAEIRHESTGLPILDVVAAYSFMDKLEVAHKASIWMDRREVLSVEVGTLRLNSEPDSYTRQLVDDLATIARFADIHLTVPERLTWAQRREIRKCRLIIDGQVILEPDFGRLSAHLNGTHNKQMLESIRSSPIMATVETKVQYLVQDHRVGIEARLFHPRAHVAGSSGIIEALESGQAEGMQMEISGIDNSPFYIYAPARRSSEGPLTPTPLAIEGDPNSSQ